MTAWVAVVEWVGEGLWVAVTDLEGELDRVDVNWEVDLDSSECEGEWFGVLVAEAMRVSDELELIVRVKLTFEAGAETE